MIGDLDALVQELTEEALGARMPTSVPEVCSPSRGMESILDTAAAEAVRSAAVGVLNEAKARLIEGLAPGARFTIAVWRATDGPVLREALRILGLNTLPLVYLEDSRVPEEYRRYGPPKLPLRGQLRVLETEP